MSKYSSLKYVQRKATKGSGLSVVAIANYIIELLKLTIPKIFVQGYNGSVVLYDKITGRLLVEAIKLRSDYNNFKTSVQKVHNPVKRIKLEIELSRKKKELAKALSGILDRLGGSIGTMEVTVCELINKINKSKTLTINDHRYLKEAIKMPEEVIKDPAQIKKHLEIIIGLTKEFQTYFNNSSLMEKIRNDLKHIIKAKEEKINMGRANIDSLQISTPNLEKGGRIPPGVGKEFEPQYK